MAMLVAKKWEMQSSPQRERSVGTLEVALVSRRTSQSFLYAIGPEELTPVKIGITGSSVKGRLVALQSGTWVNLKIYWAVEMVGSRAAAAMEEAMHTAFASRRIRGEWFAVTANDARDEFERIATLRSISFKEITDYGRCF